MSAPLNVSPGRHCWSRRPNQRQMQPRQHWQHATLGVMAISTTAASLWLTHETVQLAQGRPVPDCPLINWSPELRAKIVRNLCVRLVMVWLGTAAIVSDFWEGIRQSRQTTP